MACCACRIPPTPNHPYFSQQPIMSIRHGRDSFYGSDSFHGDGFVSRRFTACFRPFLSANLEFFERLSGLRLPGNPLLHFSGALPTGDLLLILLWWLSGLYLLTKIASLRWFSGPYLPGTFFFLFRFGGFPGFIYRGLYYPPLMAFAFCGGPLGPLF